MSDTEKINARNKRRRDGEASAKEFKLAIGKIVSDYESEIVVPIATDATKEAHLGNDEVASLLTDDRALDLLEDLRTEEKNKINCLGDKAGQLFRSLARGMKRINSVAGQFKVNEYCCSIFEDVKYIIFL